MERKRYGMVVGFGITLLVVIKRYLGIVQGQKEGLVAATFFALGYIS